LRDPHSFPTRRSSDLWRGVVDQRIVHPFGDLVDRDRALGYGCEAAAGVPIDNSIGLGRGPDRRVVTKDAASASAILLLGDVVQRSEEHTSELQSLRHL